MFIERYEYKRMVERIAELENKNSALYSQNNELSRKLDNARPRKTFVIHDSKGTHTIKGTHFNCVQYGSDYYNVYIGDKLIASYTRVLRIYEEE